MRMGSTWRKWDLHLHTPGTAKADRYGDSTLEEFCDAVLESGVAAIGVTDYFSVESAFAVKEILAQRESEVQVFPNVELRDSRTPSDSRLNFHILFSNELSKKDVELALARVPVQIAGHNSRFLNGLDHTDIESALADIKEVRERLSESFNGEQPFLILTASGSDGYRPEGDPTSWSKMATTEADLIIRMSDAVFGNAKDATFWTAPDNFDRKPRPVFCGSDAHDLESVTQHSASEKCTWIKGEVSFSGLKEALIEPTSRVRIQKFNPDDKDPARIIKSIEITEKTDYWRKKFNQVVNFNPALNSVIGARSSGKSILAAALSYACNPTRTKEAQLRVVSPSNQKYLGPAGAWSWDDFSKEIDIKLHWANGVVSTPDDPTGHLTYLPQGYLNSLAEDPYEIQLLLEKAISSIAGNKTQTAFRSIAESHTKTTEEITDLVTEIFDSCDKLKEATEESKNLGKFTDLENRKEVLKKKQNQLAGRNLSESDNAKLADYQEAARRIGGWEPYDSVKTKEEFKQSLERTLRPAINSEAEINLATLLDQKWNTLLEKFQSEASALFDEYSDAEHRAREAVIVLRDTYAMELKSQNGNVLPSQGSDESKKIEEELFQVNGRIQSIRKANTTITECKEKLHRACSRLISLRRSYFNQISRLKKNENASSTEIEDIQIGIDFGFPEENLPIVDFALKNNAPIWSEYCEYITDLQEESADNFADFEELLELIVSSEFKLKRQSEKRRGELVQSIASLLPEPRLYGRYDGDRFGGFAPSGMSAGKRALAGLSLLLVDETSVGPLILDQPEDDLDSRSIAGAIVPYLRNAKNKRQVIIVSHNANLVVGTDSELVLVANQGNQTYKNPGGLRYFYGAGALESRASNETSKWYFEKASVKDHICELLDGGIESFEKRARRYT